MVKVGVVVKVQTAPSIMVQVEILYLPMLKMASPERQILKSLKVS